MDPNYIEAKVEKKQSGVINSLRAMATIFVVLHHAMSYGESYLGGGGVIYSELKMTISSVHVPLFFMIAGYLCHSQSILKYYKKKILQIFIPFFVFSSLKLIINVFLNPFNNSSTLGVEMLKAYVFGEYYWFSYSLLIMCLAAPLLWKVKSRVVLVGLFLLLLSFDIKNNFFYFPSSGGPFQVYNALIYSVWFFLGYVLRQLNAGELLNKKVIKRSALMLAVAVSALVIFLSMKGMFNRFIGKFILSLSLSYVMLYVFSSMHVKIPLLEEISRYSYQIFFLDSFVKVALFSLASRVLTINLPIIILIAALNIVISTMISFTAHKIKYVKWLFGLF